MPVAIEGSNWVLARVTPETAAIVRRVVPGRRIRQVSLAAHNRRSWTAWLIRRGRSADPAGRAVHARTIRAAVAAAVRDMALGAPLAWCSHCSRPARFQREGEAYCRRHERNRGGTIR